MNGVELTEAWLFEQLRRGEETKLRDPEDVYLEVKRLESERADKGLPPRLEFIEDPGNQQVATVTLTVGREIC